VTSSLRLAIAGLGLVGKRHAEAISHVTGVDLVAVVDPQETGQTAAAMLGIPCVDSVETLLANEEVDGIILATPTLLHVEQATACVERDCAVLVEKPIGTSAQEARALVQMAERRSVPLLVGHHRRHNPLIQRAKKAIDEGLIGNIRALQATCWFYKPDSYFSAAPWRMKTGAGPVSVNLVHDIDLVRHLCGEISAVHAVSVPSVRGYENEDVAGVLLEFNNGVIGTLSVSDSVVAPWSWECTSRENPNYPPMAENAYFIGGTEGSLSVPDLRLWTHQDRQQDWSIPLTATTLTRTYSDPLVNQISHFRDVILRKAPPLVSGAEGARTLQVIEAIQTSARHRSRMEIKDILVSTEAA